MRLSELCLQRSGCGVAEENRGLGHQSFLSLQAGCQAGRVWRMSANAAPVLTRHTMTHMDRHTPTVAEVVTRAVELVDPNDVDEAMGHLQRQLEDDIEPITAVENLEERL